MRVERKTEPNRFPDVGKLGVAVSILLLYQSLPAWRRRLPNFLNRFMNPEYSYIGG